MKRFLSLFIIVNLLGCSPKKSFPAKPPKPLSENMQQFENMQRIEKSTKNLKLKIGEEVFYQVKVHGSVGKRTEVHVDNEDRIQQADPKIDYDNTDRATMPGGDSATKTFVFRGVSPGDAKITIKNLYRGDVQNEQVVDCIVSKE